MTDEEYLDLKSNIEIYAEILLGILRYTSVKNLYEEGEYLKELTKKLKFEKVSDPDLFRACIDLIEDSQDAINDVLLHGVLISYKRSGEKYLRIYGVLNACWLLVEAVIDLMRLFNLKNQKRNAANLKSMKIIELRNKIASHTTSYRKSPTDKIEFYQLAQASITKWGDRLLIIGSKETVEEINLINNIKLFIYEIENVLHEIVYKELYARTFKKEHFVWLDKRYKYILEKNLRL